MMIEFGKTLRSAREAAGLTVAQLAERTHMAPSRIEELESENFAKIPAAIYGRGFVRLYCEAVGLDPKPLSDEFTAIFDGSRDLEIREREPDAVLPEAEPEPERPATTEDGRDIPQPPPEAEPPPEPAPLSRYAAPIRERRSGVPPTFWRIGALALAAALVAVAAGVGLCALYRATGGDRPSPDAAAAQPAESAPSAAPQPRDQQKIPPLYID